MGDNSNFSRRGFLMGGGTVGTALAAEALFPTPFERLLNVLSSGFIAKAQAEATGIEGSRNFVNILMHGAPLRYTFDAWMRTSSSDAMLEFNPMVATRFLNSGGRVSGVEYGTFTYNGKLVPHMFSHNVMTSAGAVPLTRLLDNMLVIRGYGTGFDGHQFNSVVQQAPVGGISSLMGLAADYSKKTFEAVEWPNRGAAGSFSSLQGKALCKLNSPPLNSLLEGFGGPQGGRVKGRSLKDRNQEAFELARARLKAYAQSDFVGASIVGKNLDNASALMKKGIGDIGGYWNAAVARYKSVIEASMRQQGLVGINDIPLISDEGGFWKVHVADGNRGLVVSKDFDMREATKTMTAPGSLAEGLALAEYVLKEGLVTALNLQMGDLTNISLKEKGQASVVSHTGIKDMHETGAISGVLLTTAYYRGLSAGILELSNQLKAASAGGKDLWSETVVQLISEFSRTARSNGGGSDHGYNQMVTSCFSGAIKSGPFVVGNIYKSGHNASYGGSQGRAAPIDGYNQAGMPTPTMAASTVASLLRVPKNPYENLAAPLVRLIGDNLVVEKPAKVVG